MPILVTGFEPFAGAQLNPSQQLVAKLQLRAKELGVVTAVLAVEYDKAAAELQQLIELHAPTAVICLGQAEGRKAISIETVAQNLDHANLADNAGEVRLNKAIDEGGPSSLSTTLTVDALLNRLSETGFAAESSQSAGTFVCNHIFYRMQQLLLGTAVPSGFIHLPLMPEQAEHFEGQPTMPLDIQLGAIIEVVKFLKEA
jgi:pyroglutamyl-peptidase